MSDNGATRDNWEELAACVDDVRDEVLDVLQERARASKARKLVELCIQRMAENIRQQGDAKYLPGAEELAAQVGFKAPGQARDVLSEMSTKLKRRKPFDSKGYRVKIMFSTAGVNATFSKDGKPVRPTSKTTFASQDDVNAYVKILEGAHEMMRVRLPREDITIPKGGESPVRIDVVLRKSPLADLMRVAPMVVLALAFGLGTGVALSGIWTRMHVSPFDGDIGAVAICDPKPSMLVTWNYRRSDASVFRIFRDGVPLATIQAHRGENSYRDMTAIPGKVVTYNVEALAEAGQRISTSGTAQGILKACPPPGNHPPVCDRIETSPQAGTAPLDVTLRAVASDADGDPLTYAWNFGDNKRADGPPSIVHRYATGGRYLASVMVSDPAGAVSVCSAELIFGGTLPKEMTGLVRSPVDLIAMPICDPTPAIRLEWKNTDSMTTRVRVRRDDNVLDEIAGTATSYIDQDLHPGTRYRYVVEAGNKTAWAEGGSETAVGLAPDCKRANRPPTCEILASETEGEVPYPDDPPYHPFVVNLHAVASDPDGDDLSYAWDFGNYRHGVGQLSAGWYFLPGRYVITLRVADGHGGNASCQKNVVVSADAKK